MATASGTVRSIHPMWPTGGGLYSAIRCSLRRLSGRRRRSLRGPLHHYGELRHQCSDRSQCRQNGGKNDADGRHGQRDLHVSVALVILNNDAPDIAFVDEFTDFVGKVLALDFKLFEELPEFVHE